MANTPIKFTFKTNRETGLRAIGHYHSVDIKIKRKVVGSINHPSSLSGEDLGWRIRIRVKATEANKAQISASDHDVRLGWKNVLLARKHESSDVARKWIEDGHLAATMTQLKLEFHFLEENVSP